MVELEQTICRKRKQMCSLFICMCY